MTILIVQIQMYIIMQMRNNYVHVYSTRICGSHASKVFDLTSIIYSICTQISTSVRQITAHVMRMPCAPTMREISAVSVLQVLLEMDTATAQVCMYFYLFL